MLASMRPRTSRTSGSVKPRPWRWMEPLRPAGLTGLGCLLASGDQTSTSPLFSFSTWAQANAFIYNHQPPPTLVSPSDQANPAACISGRAERRAVSTAARNTSRALHLTTQKDHGKEFDQQVRERTEQIVEISRLLGASSVWHSRKILEASLHKLIPTRRCSAS